MHSECSVGEAILSRLDRNHLLGYVVFVWIDDLRTVHSRMLS